MRLQDMLSPLRHPSFRRLFLARVISMTGTSLAPVALAFGVLAATDSAGALGLVLAAYSVPALVFLLIGGVWADRLPRHRLMASSDLVRAVTQTTFGVLLLTGHTPLWLMMALQAISGAAGAFAGPALVGLTKSTAPAASLQQANALLSLAADLSMIAGPLIAGVLTITVGAGWALIVDGASFLGSAWLLSGLRLPAVERTAQRFFVELREGWREVIRRDWLWVSITYFAFFNLAFAIFLVLGPAQLSDVANGALSWGAISAALSVGSLLGNVLAMRLQPRRLLRWARLVELLAPPLVFALALQASVPVLIVTAFLMGITISFPDALWYTALQQEVPDEALSRVSAFDTFGSFISQPVGYALAAVFVTVGTTTSLFVVGITLATVTLLTMLSPGVRNLQRRVETPADKPADAGIVPA